MPIESFLEREKGRESEREKERAAGYFLHINEGYINEISRKILSFFFLSSFFKIDRNLSIYELCIYVSLISRFCILICFALNRTLCYCKCIRGIDQSQQDCYIIFSRYIINKYFKAIFLFHSREECNSGKIMKKINFYFEINRIL